MNAPYSPLGPRPPSSHRIAKIWRPALYQDGRKRLGYFEGWYFKSVDADGLHPIAVIPGIALDVDGQTSHAFVQIIRSDASTSYWEYPASEFRFATDHFEIAVGSNSFSESGLTLALDGEAGQVKGGLTFSNWQPWPVRLFAPGIMGWYRFVPFMETYHGVLSLDHEVSGALDIDGEQLGFDGGRGYVEKDWGRSFPSAWVWAQSNHFSESGTSITASLARIPWMRSAFVGYIVGFLHDGQLHEFTTYNGAKMTAFSLGEGRVELTLARRDLEIDVSVEGAHPGKLRSPLMGAMDGVTWESLDARIGVAMRRQGHTVFEGVGVHAGAEFMDTDGVLAEGLSLG